jgi:ABC-type multidrug transport system fused ATPase/permease subunit
MVLAATNFPLLNVFLTMLWFFLFVVWLMLLFRVFADVFRSDMGGVAKALWVVFVIVLPFLGVLAYLIARGPKMAQRELEAYAAQEDAARDYIRSVASTGASPTEELARLVDLRDRGVLDDAEYAAMKAKVIA